MTAICLLGAVGPILDTVGIKYAGVAVGGALSATAPLFSVLLELVFFGELLNTPTITGAVATVLGIVILRTS